MVSNPRMLVRRSFLIAGLGLAHSAFAQTTPARLDDPLRVGVDHALIGSGLARALQLAFGRDTGIAIVLRPGPASTLLEALDGGEIDVTLTNAPELEERMVASGLAHDRREVAVTETVIVGPAPQRKQPDPIGIAGGRDVVAALARLRDAGAAGLAGFVSAGDGSGVHLLEQRVWRAAKLAPAAPWYSSATGGAAALVAQVRAQGGYALVDRGAWAASGGLPQAVLVEGDPALQLPVHVMRPFRTRHRASKLYIDWLAGPRGRGAARSVRGVR